LDEAERFFRDTIPSALSFLQSIERRETDQGRERRADILMEEGLLGLVASAA
jgi:hypothetical protein